MRTKVRTSDLGPAEALGGSCACGAVTTARVARIAMCGPCAATLLDLVRGRLIVRRDGVGLGVQTGPLRLDYGPNWARLECELCGASWVGPIGESCAWCEQRLEQTLAGQRRLLLRPELPERGDRRRVGALKAWGARMRVAHDAGTITRGELDAAWTRETK